MRPKGNDIGNFYKALACQENKQTQKQKQKTKYLFPPN